jgi:hypothetical protein
MQLAAFPSCRLRTDISGIGQVLAAYSCGGSRGIDAALGAQDAYHIPSSLFHSKEAIKWCSTASRGGVVNGTIVGAGAMHYAGAVVRCSSKPRVGE